MLADHHRLVRQGLAAHGGKEVSTQGDGFFAVFSSASGATAAAAGIQADIAAHPWPAGVHVAVRMGIHAGEASETSTGLVGFDVHRAARVGAAAHGGQILLSESAAALARDTLPEGASLRDLGPHRLKDLGRPEQLFQLDAPDLARSFPPLRTLDNPALANNLPAQLATFIGRAGEVAEVRALVARERLVTLTGAGGSGKTRLALQVAAELLDGSGDGVWLVELAPVTDEDEVAANVASVLGVAVAPGRPVLDVLVDALATQFVLVVLDNCEHLVGACAKVSDALVRRCPRVHLLVTSREPLGIGGETIYRVPSLSLPAPDAGDEGAGPSDAVALFVDRARSQGVELVLDGETLPLVVSTCRRLDGMPLAIELAAARLRSLSLPDLHDLLDQRFRLLTGGSRSAMERQRTLRATVDWSYSLLNDPEKAVLRRLSVFSDGFDLAAAGAVCAFGDIEVFDVTDILGSLVDKSLVVADPGDGGFRYRLLETIRQYAAERMAETETDEAAAAFAAHGDHYLSLAEEAAGHLTGPDQRRWLDRLAADDANLRRAIDHALTQAGGTETVLRFAVALRRYWWTRRRDMQIDDVLAAVDRPDAQDHPALVAGTLITCTNTAWVRSPAQGLHQSERALAAARRAGDRALEAGSLGVMSATLYFAGRIDEALPFGEQSVALGRQRNDDGAMGELLSMYLLSASLRRTAAETEDLYAEAIACSERAGDLFVLHVLTNNAGCHYLRAGDVVRARQLLEEAMASADAVGGPSWHPVLVNLGWVYRLEGNSAAAADMFERALRASRRSGDVGGLAYSVLGLACLAGDAGDFERAAVLHGVAQAAFDRTVPCQEPEDTYRQASVADVRAQLGDDAFDRALRRGAGAAPEEALALVLTPGT